ncbi:hypothetical protein G7Y79_00061g092790 [Physcia stellaris]|nr:hypothetical protein G7Y79_00061g092790 [Physcia stellaris]
MQFNGSWVPDGEAWECTGPTFISITTSTSIPPVTTPRSTPDNARSPSDVSTPPVVFQTSSDISTGRSASSTISNSVRPSSHSLIGSRLVPLSNQSQTTTITSKTSSAHNFSATATSAQTSAHVEAFNISTKSVVLVTPPGPTTSSVSIRPLNSSVEVPSVPPTPSSSSLLPNLACPSDSAMGEAKSATGGESNAGVADHTIMQACNPDMLRNSGNLSSTTNSSNSPEVPGQVTIDPDKGGSYLQLNATSDQQSHCLNIAAHQYQACWAVLNVTGYLQDWVAFNKGKCDDEDMGFADCFLYLEVGGGANCTSFTGRSQCPSPDSKTFLGRPNSAQAYYVAFNIWNIQNWFFTYYMAVTGANGLAADSVGTIARTLNLPEPKAFPILDILAGLAFAFGLLSPSGYAAALPKLGQRIEGLAAQAPGEYLLRAIQNSPTLSRVLLDHKGLDDSNLQISALSSDLARIVSQLQTNIQNTIVLVMSNYSTFFDFVEDGFFSTQIDNLNTVTQNVTLSLNTYIVSQALQDDDVIITRALNTDVNELQLNGSAYQYDTGCGYGYDEWGMCGCWWYDSTNRISYGLESKKDMLNNYTDALESLFNQGITTPELLFMNSQFCADSAGSTQGNAPGTSLSTDTGVWNTECISNMKICTWDTVNLGVENEYTDCERDSAFAMEGCGAALEVVQAVVPASYIGQYLTGWEFQGVVCNHWDHSMGNPNG